MSPANIFYPPRRNGLIFHSACLLALAGLSVLALTVGLRQAVGGTFVLLLLGALLLFAPLPLLSYQAYALLRARYQFDRDGLHLRWGMRAEDIPLEEVEWARPAGDLPTHIPSPWPGLPGALSGSVTVEGVGPVEFMAAERARLVLVATRHKIYAISPEDPQAFLRAFQEAFEMGSLARIPAQSVLPAAYLAQVWGDLVARWLLITGALLSVLLLVSISLVIPGRTLVSMGFYPDGRVLPSAPAAQLLLLPVLGMMFFIVDLGVGLFFYRSPAYRILGYIVWGSSIATSLLLAGAAVWIL
jgi:hypothetical protein